MSATAAQPPVISHGQLASAGRASIAWPGGYLGIHLDILRTLRTTSLTMLV